MVRELIDANEDIVVIDNLSTGSMESIPNDIPFYKGDIADYDLVKSIIKNNNIKSVLHFAAKIIVSESINFPLQYYDNNTFKTSELIRASIDMNVENFVFSSTAAVYGVVSSIPVLEINPTLPISPYGSSKLMSEWILRDAAKAHKLRYAIIRYFNVAGADPFGRTGSRNPNATHLIKAALQAALKVRSNVEIYGNDFETPDGTGVRDYIHVSDLVNIHLKMLNDLRSGTESAIINAGYGKGYSVLEVIQSVRRVSNLDINTVFMPRRDGDAASVIADTSNLRHRLKWMPRYDNIDTIISHALNWEKIMQSTSFR